MEEKRLTSGRGRKRLSRRDFIKVSVGAGIGLGGTYLLGCTAPPAPTPTPKPAAPAPAATKPAAAAPKPAGPPKQVVMGTTTGTLGVLTAVIKKQKIDLKYGVDLDLKIFEPADAERAVALKRVEVGNYAPISAVTANNEGLPIVLIAPLLWNVNYFMVWKDTPYQKVTDLKGKKIATSPKISGAYTSAQVFFKELGLDFEKDFTIVTGPPMAQAGLLQKKEVDATLFSDPWALQLIDSEIRA
ncbi:MAG: ABC transporter substrate-binding protein [Chloroflexi bacterium]|nr:ABC transporter substrate-binding protein [Chloroflexota bacterium]